MRTAFRLISVLALMAALLAGCDRMPQMFGGAPQTPAATAPAATPGAPPAPAAYAPAPGYAAPAPAPGYGPPPAPGYAVAPGYAPPGPGYAPPPGGAPAPVVGQAGMPPEAPCVACGYVESVRYITKEGEGTGAGAVMGGVAGGVIGHQVGSGRGNDAATVLGALGGAYAGHQIEKNARKKTFWQVRVRLDTGEVRYLTYGNQPAFRQGDRVSLASGRLALIANQ